MQVNEPETIRSILENTKTIAVIGLSDKPDRASFWRLPLHAKAGLPYRSCQSKPL